MNKTKKKSKKKIFIILAVLVIAAIFIVPKFLGNAKTAKVETVSYLYEKPEKRTVGTNLTSTGTLESKDSYSVTSLVSGKILSADFEEGQNVEKDTVLYKVDDSDAKNSLEKLNNSLIKAEKSHSRLIESLDDLKIKTTEAGQLIELNVKKGDIISAGTFIGTVRNSKQMLIKVPFLSDAANSFKVGDAAKVVVSDTYETIDGKVKEIKNVEEVLSGHRLIKYVVIEVENPGAIAKGDTATVNVNDITCVENGSFEYKSEYQLLAKQSGEVESIYYSEGDDIADKSTVVKLNSDSLSDNIDSSQSAIDDIKLSIDSQKDILDNYTIKSPISGTVIEKNYKVDDKANQTKALCTIFDMSYLKTTMNIDENDIYKVKVGQKVKISASALEGHEFTGIVTKVNINGSTNNNITTYPVSVRIDEKGELLPGMNITASIELTKSEDTISVPISAIVRGNYVLVKDADPSHNEADMTSPLEGYVYKTVTVGLTDENYTEILSGLTLDDEIAYEAVQTMSFEDMMRNQGEQEGQVIY